MFSKLTFPFYEEPIGGASPKFPAALIHDISTSSGAQLALLCPAQAHPLPAFRYIFKKGRENSKNTSSILYPEPIASSGPKVPKEAKFNEFSEVDGQQFALICPVQSFPAPAFRYYETTFQSYSSTNY